MSEHTLSPDTGRDADVIDLRDLLAARMGEAATVTATGYRGATVGTLREPTAAETDEDEAVYVVDLADEDAPAWTGARPQPVLPAALRGKEAVKATAAAAGALALNRSAFHGLRSPLYLARFLRVTGIGARWTVRTAWNFFTVGELGRMIDTVQRQNLGEEHALALREQRAKVVKVRRKAGATLAGAAAFGMYGWGWPLLVEALGATGALWGGGVLTAAVLHALGRRELQRRGEVVPALVDQAPAVERTDGPVTDERILAAMATVGLIKGDVRVVPVGPVQPLDGGALLHTYDLVGNLKAGAVIAKSEDIAAQLRLPADQVDITRGEHEGQVVIWTATRNPFREPRTSPLFGKGGRVERTDLWNIGVPIGYDRRGNVVYLRLRHAMALLGGMSQTGKGMLLRNIIAGVALDPRVNIRVVSGRKIAELVSFAPVCATFFGGREERLLALLEAFKAEADRRDAYMEENGVRRLTEKDLDRFPLEVLVIDEAQVYTDDAKVVKLLEKISGYAASLNMTILLVTQDPDAGTVPPKFKKNTKSRGATKTASAAQTNAILNDGATGNGLAAHHIPVSTPGLAIIDADGAPGVLIRSFFLEDREYDAVLPLVEAAAEIRRAAKRLPGQFRDPIEDALVAKFGTSSAAGGPRGMGRPGPVATGVLADLLAVFAARPGVERLATADVLAALAEIRPDVWSPAALGDPADYTRAGGALLAKAVREALDNTPRSLQATQWTEADEARGGRRTVTGYRLDHVRTAAGLS